MSFVGLGMMELVVLMAGLSGLPANDLVSMLSPSDYFASRGVTINAKEMMTLAGKEPATPKDQIQQLLAIRWLGENPTPTKRTDGARELLDDIASGKKAQDKLGFAKAHARRTVALLDGKTPPPIATSPDASVKREGLSWFPAEMNWAGGYDFRADKNTSEASLEMMRKMAGNIFSGKERKNLYDTSDKLGNVRLDRVTVAARLDENGSFKQTIVRVTFAGDAKQLMAMLGGQDAVKLEEHKTPTGEKVLAGAMKPYVYAFVGDNDFLFMADESSTKPFELLDSVLSVKAGKGKNFASNAQGKLLQEAPATARFVAVGELPERAQKAIVTEQGSPFRAAPQRILVYSAQEKKMMLTAHAILARKQDAMPFRDSLIGLRQQALKALDNAPGKAPKELIKRFRETLEGIKVDVEESTVKGRLAIDPETIMNAVEALFKSVDIAPPPPPPPPPVGK